MVARWIVACGLGLALMVPNACVVPADSSSSQLTVAAASSLRDAFEQLAAAFERQNPDVQVQLTSAGSHRLKMQIEQGSPTHIFASADRAHAEHLRSLGLLQGLRSIASNRLVLITSKDQGRVTSFADIIKSQRLILGLPEVPIGRYSRAVLRKAGLDKQVLAQAVSFESNSRVLRAKVQLGEADAALVYESDVRGVDDLRVLPVPQAFEVLTDVTIGALVPVRDPARRWLDFMQTEEAQALMRAHGFGKAL